MEPQVAGALAGAIAGVGAGSGTRYVLDRRSEHAQARSIARLIFREIEDVRKYLDAALDSKEPWPGGDFSIPAWERHGHQIAGELADGELLAISTSMHWVATVNEWRAAFLNEEESRWPGRRRQERPWEESDSQLLAIASQVLLLASQAITPLQRGRRAFVFRRRIPRSLSPPLDTPCECGHAFANHHWRSRRLGLGFGNLALLTRTSAGAANDANVSASNSQTGIAWFPS